MSKSFSCVVGSMSSAESFDSRETFFIETESYDLGLESEANEIEANIRDRVSFEEDHPYEWSDYGFGCDLSNFVFD